MLQSFPPLVFNASQQFFVPSPLMKQKVWFSIKKKTSKTKQRDEENKLGKESLFFISWKFIPNEEKKHHMDGFGCCLCLFFVVAWARDLFLSYFLKMSNM